MIRLIGSPNGLKIEYVYDENGNPTLITNRYNSTSAILNQTEYRYNGYNAIESIKEPLNRVTTFSYDSAGNLKEKVSPAGNTVGYKYNKANRMTQITYNGQPQYSFVYDANGNRLKVTEHESNKIWNYGYDIQNQLTSVTYPDGSSQKYLFDINGNLEQQEIKIGSTTYLSRYAYGINDRKLIELTDHKGQEYRFAYDEQGNLTLLNKGNQTVAHYAYDDASYLQKVINTKSDGTMISSYTYTYLDNGNQKSVVDQSGKVIYYDYDALDQLTQETDPLSDNTIHYTHDILGNIKTREVKDPSGATVSKTTYHYNSANQLTSIQNGPTFQYDANGNLLVNGKSNHEYKWDAENRLVEVINRADNKSIANYEYDSDGRRVKSIVNGKVTNFHYDGDSIRVLFETDATGKLEKLYEYSPEGLLLSMTIPGQGTYNYHYNGHGDVVQLTNQQQQIVARYTYDAWGNIVSSSGNLANTNPYRYAGYRYDNETNLYYLNARYYDSSLMRFISQDPVPHNNLYIYASNNPVLLYDPTGEESRTIITAVDGGGKLGGRNTIISGGHGQLSSGVSTPKGYPKITTPYKRPSYSVTPTQRKSVQGKPCVTCGKNDGGKRVADHKKPLVQEYYETGTIDKGKMREVNSVQPQCKSCSAKQGAEMSLYSKQMKLEFGLTDPYLLK